MAWTQMLAGAATVAALAGGSDLPRGGEPVRLDPADFTTRIDNPYFPLTPGDRRVYRATDSEGLEQRVVATVTHDTKPIANGVTARVVYTVVLEKGRRVEDNRAWYAQDRSGNVWYLGELAREFEDGRLKSTDGSWEAGVDGAQPGVIMPARPRAGLAYRQEHAKGVAEDRAEIVGLRERAEVPAGRFRRVLLIKETEPIERGLLDYKLYARGVGLVLGMEVSGGSGREELVRFRRGPRLASSASAPACRPTETTPVPQPSPARMTASGLGRLPVAPVGRRVDLVAPPFSNPTSITNPLFPISELGSVLLNGRVDGKAFRTETTLLPETRVVEWSPGQCVKTVVSQYAAYLDGRLHEVALDFYAQADDGSVWYFGEDVYNYERGMVADTSGTWLAGKEGPAAMIMPAAPKPGDVNRPENIPGLVWEEVAVKAVGKTVRAPRGPVTGALVGRELHDDGSFSDKLFAPGYGEFYTASKGEVEALALAVPTDAKAGGTPAALRKLSAAAWSASKAAGTGRWRQAAASSGAATRAWKVHRAADVPRRLVAPTNRAVARVDRAVERREGRTARHEALDLVQASLDLRLQYEPIPAIDRARFSLWAERARVDAAARARAELRGDVATLEWIRDRIAHTLQPVRLTRLDRGLETLRANVTDGDLKAAARTAGALRKMAG